MMSKLMRCSGIVSQVMSAVANTRQVKYLEALLSDRNSVREMLATFVKMQLHVVIL